MKNGGPADSPKRQALPIIIAVWNSVCGPIYGFAMYGMVRSQPVPDSFKRFELWEQSRFQSMVSLALVATMWVAGSCFITWAYWANHPKPTEPPKGGEETTVETLDLRSVAAQRAHQEKERAALPT